MPFAVPVTLADQALHLVPRKLQRTMLAGRGELMPVREHVQERQLHREDTILPCTTCGAHGQYSCLLRLDLVWVELLDLVQLVQYLCPVIGPNNSLLCRDHIVEVLRQRREFESRWNVAVVGDERWCVHLEVERASPTALPVDDTDNIAIGRHENIPRIEVGMPEGGRQNLLVLRDKSRDDGPVLLEDSE